MTGLAFTAPWVLAAAAALALPVLAHLARHEDRQGRGFPSLMFLRRVPFPVRARRRVRDRVLLALRLLALLALVLAFAGLHPVYEDGAAGPGAERDTVVLLDRSSSMGLGDRFDAARAEAAAVLDGVGPGERVALVGFDAAPRVLSGLDAGVEAARRALADAAPGHRETDLARALDGAAALLAHSRAAVRRVVMVSDLQASGLGADPRLPRDRVLELRPVGGPVPRNLALVGAWLEPARNGSAGPPPATGAQRGPARLAVRVVNTGAVAAASSLRVRVDGLDAGEEALRLAPGESRELSLPVFPDAARSTRISVHLDDDALLADNQRFLVAAPVRDVRALLVGDAGSAPFVDAALALARDPRVTLSRAAPDAVEAATLRGVDVVILDAPLAAAARNALAARLRDGLGALVFAPGADGLAGLLGAEPGAWVERADGAAMAPVVGAPRAGPARVLGAAAVGPVWRYRRLVPAAGARVLARFDDGAPALVQGPAGAGRLLVLATSPAPDFGAIATRPEFPPLLIESVSWLARLAPVPQAYPPGSVVDAVALAGAVAGGASLAAALRDGEPLLLRTPDGRMLRRAADVPVSLDAPGFHELRAGGSGDLPIAVSAAATEADLAALTPQAFLESVQRTAPGTVGAAIGAAPPAPDERLARALLLIGTVLLLVEGLLAALLARRRMPVAAPHECAAMSDQAAHATLVRALRTAGRRWRDRRLLEGAAITIAGGALAGAAAIGVMDALRFDDDVVASGRIAVYTVLGVLAAVFLLARVPWAGDARRIARHLERRDPALDALLVTAVEVAPGAARDGAPADGAAPGLSRRLFERAAAACDDPGGATRGDRVGLRRGAWTVVALLAVLAGALWLAGPGWRHGAALLAAPWAAAGDGAPYTLEATPGSVTINEGADLVIGAVAGGFSPREVTLVFRPEGHGDWTRVALVPDDDGRLEALLPAVSAPLEYWLEAETLRSEGYRVDLRWLPRVGRLDHRYHYPAYTGLDTRLVERATDIAAVSGTEVDVRVVPRAGPAGDASVRSAGAGDGVAGGSGEPVRNSSGELVRSFSGELVPSFSGELVRNFSGELMRNFSGELVLDGERRRALTPDGDALVARLSVDEAQRYRIELESVDGALVPVTPDHAVSALADGAPAVEVLRPLGDARVTQVEEVEVTVRADDDVSLRQVELVLSVNGGPEEVVALDTGSAAASVTGLHLLSLENRDLAPGDLVAFHARASDGVVARTAVSDIHFMEVRPFDRDYSRGRSGGGQRGGGGGQQDGNLAAQQRDLVVALFRLARDRERLPEDERSGRLATLSEAQSRIRDRVEAIVRRIQGRAMVQSSPGLKVMIEEMPKATTAMRRVEALLGVPDPDAALPPAREALSHLQRADAAFREVQVASQQGGGGGQGRADNNDLSRLFELEIDRFRNRYSDVQRSQSPARQQQVDEALKRLEELARRQRQEVERARRRMQRDDLGGGGAPTQQAVAAELEELLRRLERLSRERPGAGLDTARESLEQAAQAMRESASQGGDRAAREALDRLQQARDALSGEGASQIARTLDDARRRAQSLAERQSQVRQRLAAGDTGAGPPRSAGDRPQADPPRGGQAGGQSGSESQGQAGGQSGGQSGGQAGGRSGGSGASPGTGAPGVAQGAAPPQDGARASAGGSEPGAPGAPGAAQAGGGTPTQRLARAAGAGDSGADGSPRAPGDEPVGSMSTDGPPAEAAAREPASLDELKAAMEADARALREALDGLAAGAADATDGAGREQLREATRGARQAAGILREEDLEGRLRRSRERIAAGVPDENLEQTIGRTVERVEEQVARAAQAAAEGARAGAVDDAPDAEELRALMRELAGLREQVRRGSGRRAGTGNAGGARAGDPGAAWGDGWGPGGRNLPRLESLAGGLDRLRGPVASNPDAAGDLETLIDGIRSLAAEPGNGVSGGPEAAALLEALAGVERALARAAASGDPAVTAADDGRAPDGYGTLVDDYYRRLSRGDSR